MRPRAQAAMLRAYSFLSGLDVQDRVQGRHGRRRLGTERSQDIGRMPLLAELLGVQLIGPLLHGLAFRPDRRLGGCGG